MKDPSVPLLIDFRMFQVFHLGFFVLSEMKIFFEKGKDRVGP
jgi:hypothetical protein